jgi:hypothetical protein
MPPRIKNAIVDIPMNGVMVKGILSGDETNWSFQSLSRGFLALFADGIVNSYTYLGFDTRTYEQHKVQLLIAGLVKDLLAERRDRAKVKPQPTPVSARRIVVP